MNYFVFAAIWIFNNDCSCHCLSISSFNQRILRVLHGYCPVCSTWSYYFFWYFIWSVTWNFWSIILIPITWGLIPFSVCHFTVYWISVLWTGERYCLNHFIFTAIWSFDNDCSGYCLSISSFNCWVLCVLHGYCLICSIWSHYFSWYFIWSVTWNLWCTVLIPVTWTLIPFSVSYLTIYWISVLRTSEGYSLYNFVLTSIWVFDNNYSRYRLSISCFNCWILTVLHSYCLVCSSWSYWFFWYFIWSVAWNLWCTVLIPVTWTLIPFSVSYLTIYWISVLRTSEGYSLYNFVLTSIWVFDNNCSRYRLSISCCYNIRFD